MKLSQHNSLKRNAGFTLIELVVVIVLLGILAVTALGKFIDLSSDAQSATVAGVGASFSASVNSVHFRWAVSGSPGAVLDYIPITSASGSGALSVNANGWPADMRGVSLTLNSTADCVDVWVASFTSGPSISTSNNTANYRAIYNGSNRCTYVYQDNTNFNIQFDSNTGQVTINN